MSSPLYATAVGLVIKSINNNSRSSATPFIELKKEEPIVVQAPVSTEEPTATSEQEAQKTSELVSSETTTDKIKRSFLDKYIDKIKEFLDNAE